MGDIKQGKGAIEMSMNAIHCCAVFSPHRLSAISKLREIANDHNADFVNDKYGIRLVLDNGEKWQWINPETPAARGHRAHKAFVDTACSIRALHRIIIPACESYCTELEYYDTEEEWI